MSSTSEGARDAQQTQDILYEIAQLLNTGLDKEGLDTCVGMIEAGVNGEGLAGVIQEVIARWGEAGKGRGAGSGSSGRGRP